jgi:hypothetical protein
MFFDENRANANRVKHGSLVLAFTRSRSMGANRHHHVRSMHHRPNAFYGGHSKLTPNLTDINTAPVLKRRSRLHRDSLRRVVLAALQVGYRATAGFDQFVGFDAEHVVSRSRRSPHLVILKQVRVDEYPKWPRETKRGHATVGL